MKTKRLCMALVLGLGLMLGLVWLLGSGTVARATDIVVQTPLDGVANDSTCTLREAIIAANTNSTVDTCAAGGADDSIALKQATYVLTATGTDDDLGLTGDLDITSTLTIVGAGPGKTFIDANGIDRVFELLPGAGTVVFSDLTIRNGNVTGVGGGIRSHDADLTLINVEVVSNTAGGGSPDGRGGGVFVDDGTLLLDGAQILSNTASMLGGGVLVHYTNCVFTQTGGTTIAHNHTDGDGGGVAIERAKATISGGRVYSNTAGGDGGGIAILHANGTLSMDGVDVVENLSQGYGGGVYVYSGRATLSGGQIVSNTTSSGGGGVYVTGGGSAFTQTGASLIAYNSAATGGGVALNFGDTALSGGQVISNTAEGRSGGIHVSNDARLTLVNVTISGNEAKNQYGGGIFASGAVTIAHTTIASNTAASGAGGIYRSSPGVILLHNTIVAHNTPVNCSTGITSTGYNLDNDNSCKFNADGDITPTNPLLGPLTNDGGVWVHPLLAGSPAIDAGDPAFVPPPDYDQRGVGFPRMVNGRVDIGAYEYSRHEVFLPLVLKNSP
jgi:CSLREA domain-containing protein